MKKLFIMLAAAATVASCAKESTVMEAPGQAIEFGNVFVDNATRVAADDVNDPSYSANDIAAFKVYGTVNNVNILDGDDVKNIAGYDVAWSLTEAGTNTPIELYWIPGASYKFVGIVDGDKAGVTKTNVNGNNMPLTVEYTADGVTDLLCQTINKTARTDGQPNGLVEFNFTHLLSKVKFSVTNNTKASATNYQYVVRDIKFTKANTFGKYNVNNGTWTDTTKGEYTEIDDLTVASNSTEYATNEVLLIPGDVDDDNDKVGMSFTIQPQIKDKDDNWHDVGDPIEFNEEVIKLVANTAYHFHITVGLDNLIQFTVKEQPEWNTPSTDVTLQ